MATYSTNLALTLIGTGEQSGTWGTTTNTNLGTLLEQAISGYQTQACTGGTDVITIPDGADGVARNMFLELTGTGGGTLVVPAKRKLYFIYNNTSTAITVKVTGLTGVSVPAAAKVILVNNGTDIVVATNYMPSLTLGAALPIASGGTAGTTAAAARAALSAAVLGANGDITSLTGLTTPLSVAQGGTGASSTTAYAAIVGNSGGTGFASVAPGTSGNVLTSNGTSWASTATAASVSSFSAGTTGFTPSTATTGVVTLAGTLAVANGGTGVTTSTGTTNVVLSNSPTLVTPALGTPSALVGTNITGTATAFTASNVTTNANLTGGVTSVGNAATVVTNANLTGDVTSVGNATTLTNAPVIAKVLTGYVSGAGTVAATDSILQAIQKLNGNNATNANLTGAVTSVGNATLLGSFTTAQLLAAVTGETGTGAVVFGTSPTLTTPALGTPSALVGTNITGTATSFTASNVTTNANLTGDVTSVGNATTLTNAPVIAKVLTGYVSGVGTVAATDSILQAIQKLNGNAADGTNITTGTVAAARVATLNQSTTGSAATLTTGRTIAITGDLAYTSPSFNGSGNVTAAGTLATVNASVGSFTNASVTVNAKGLVTAASSGSAGAVAGATCTYTGTLVETAGLAYGGAGGGYSITTGTLDIGSNRVMTGIRSEASSVDGCEFTAGAIYIRGYNLKNN
jgi:hypothetical protein